MSDRWFVLAPAVVLVAAGAVAVAQARPRAELVQLDPNGGAVSAKVEIVGSELRIAVDGLAPRTHVSGAIERLACATRGYGRVAAGGAVADARGRASWVARDVVRAALRDGRHVVALQAGRRTVACGSLPARASVAQPAEHRHWGMWAFTRRFVD